jgi:hypothetical protein
MAPDAKYYIVENNRIYEIKTDHRNFLSRKYLALERLQSIIKQDNKDIHVFNFDNKIFIVNQTDKSLIDNDEELKQRIISKTKIGTGTESDKIINIFDKDIQNKFKEFEYNDIKKVFLLELESSASPSESSMIDPHYYNKIILCHKGNRYIIEYDDRMKEFFVKREKKELKEINFTIKLNKQDIQDIQNISAYPRDNILYIFIDSALFDGDDIILVKKRTSEEFKLKKVPLYTDDTSTSLENLNKLKKYNEELEKIHEEYHDFIHTRGSYEKKNENEIKGKIDKKEEQEKIAAEAEAKMKETEAKAEEERKSQEEANKSEFIEKINDIKSKLDTVSSKYDLFNEINKLLSSEINNDDKIYSALNELYESILKKYNDLKEKIQNQDDIVNVFYLMQCLELLKEKLNDIKQEGGKDIEFNNDISNDVLCPYFQKQWNKLTAYEKFISYDEKLEIQDLINTFEEIKDESNTISKKSENLFTKIQDLVKQFTGKDEESRYIDMHNIIDGINKIFSQSTINESLQIRFKNMYTQFESYLPSEKFRFRNEQYNDYKKQLDKNFNLFIDLLIMYYYAQDIKQTTSQNDTFVKMKTFLDNKVIKKYTDEISYIENLRYDEKYKTEFLTIEEKYRNDIINLLKFIAVVSNLEKNINTLYNKAEQSSQHGGKPKSNSRNSKKSHRTKRHKRSTTKRK